MVFKTQSFYQRFNNGLMFETNKTNGKKETVKKRLFTYVQINNKGFI